VLAAAGKRLAGSREFWRHTGHDADSPERSVIRCDRVARGRYSVTVREAVGIVALPSLQLVVEPKIPAPRFRYLLQRSPAFPRLDDHQTAAVEPAELWDLVAAWYVTALEPPVSAGPGFEPQPPTPDLARSAASDLRVCVTHSHPQARRMCGCVRPGALVCGWLW
jgi:hypothetical protein